jgi:hypothetical protein
VLRLGLGRVKVKLGLGSAKVECTMYGLVPSPSLFQNHVLTGVTSFEVYVSDVIGRRFEDWTSIRGWTSI